MRVKLDIEVPKNELKEFEEIQKFFSQAREDKAWEVIRSKTQEDLEFRSWKGL